MTFHDWARVELLSGSTEASAPYDGNCASGPGTSGYRMRRAARVVEIRIVEAAGQLRHTETAGVRRRRRADEEVRRALEVVAQAVRRTNRHAAVTGHVPRHPDPRRKVRPLVVQPGFAGRKTGIAGIQESGRRVPEDRARGAAAEVIEIEIGRSRCSGCAAPKKGSHRSPPFSVTRVPTRQVSWAYDAQIFLGQIEHAGPRMLEPGQSSR